MKRSCLQGCIKASHLIREVTQRLLICAPSCRSIREQTAFFSIARPHSGAGVDWEHFSCR